MLAVDHIQKAVTTKHLWGRDYGQSRSRHTHNTTRWRMYLTCSDGLLGHVQQIKM